VYLAKPTVYLAICRVFKFFRLFKICVVYLATCVVYLAKHILNYKVSFFNYAFCVTLLFTNQIKCCSKSWRVLLRVLSKLHVWGLIPQKNCFTCSAAHLFEK